jgi:hypothetical protein
MEEQDLIKKQAKEQAEFSLIMMHADEILELRRCAKKLFLSKLIDEYTMNQIEKKFIELSKKYHIIMTKPFREVPKDWEWMQRYLLDHLYERKRKFEQWLHDENITN